MVALACGLTLALSAGCPAQVQRAQTVITQNGPAAVQTAINLYGIAKGMAQVAALSDPNLAQAITAELAKTDTVITQAQVLLTAEQPSVSALLAIALQITAHAKALTAAAAPVADRPDARLIVSLRQPASVASVSCHLAAWWARSCGG